MTVLERKKFQIGKCGLTADPIYLVSLDSGGSKGVIFNNFAHSLDSIFLSADSAWIKDGDILDSESSYGVGNVLSFFITEDHVVFMSPQQFFNQNRKTGEVSMKFMHEYGVFGDTKYLMYPFPTPYLPNNSPLQT